MTAETILSAELGHGKSSLQCDRLNQCLMQVRAQPSDFKPRSYLLPVLEALSKHINPRVIDELKIWSTELGNGTEVDGGEFDAPAATRFHGRLLVDALGYALDACLLTFALIEDQAQIVGSLMFRDAVWWTNVALRAQAQRLCAVQAFFEAADVETGGTWEHAAAKWDPSSLLLSGAFSQFWQQHFGRRAVVPVTKFLAAISTSYEMLSEADRDELRDWLRPDVNDLIDVVQVALVLDAPGLWRGILLCTSWPELCPQALLQAVLAGGNESEIVAPAAADADDEQQQTAVRLPQWSRAKLQRHRAAFHALRSVGMQLAADDARGEGLLVQFPNRTITQILLEDRPAMSRTLQMLLGPNSFMVRPAAPVSLARCIVSLAASRLRIAEPRDQHITLSRVHARKVFELRDAAEELLSLQHQHQALLRRHLQASACEEALGPTWDASNSEAAENTQHARPGLRELQQENRAANLESQQWEMAAVDSELARNAAGSADEPPESQLAELAKEAAFADHEAVLLTEINMCLNWRIRVRVEISQLEHTLVELEATFAQFRRELVKQDEELSQLIAAGEEELTRVCERLAVKREEARTSADAVWTARMELAEKMVPLPPDPVTSTEALEAHLSKEIEALQKRSEDLEKRYKRAKAATKKR